MAAPTVLVLGGTAWLGRGLAAAALARGCSVTCLARGGAGAPPEGVRFVAADRDGVEAYAEVVGERWDAVLDVARQPGHVRGAVRALADRVGTYALVSSTSVYDHPRAGEDERAAVLPPLDADACTDPADYGRAKAACEAHVRAGVGEARALIARAGLLGGPGDASDRSGWWPLRLSRGGDVLVPDAGDQPTAVLDARDLAAWLVDAALAGRSGTVDAAGTPVPLAEHLRVAADVAGFDGRLVPAAPAWLAAREVGPWAGPRSLPLWLPPELVGLNARSGRAARTLGLAPRPLGDTLADVLRWELARPARPARAAGLDPGEERALLAELAATAG